MADTDLATPPIPTEWTAEEISKRARSIVDRAIEHGCFRNVQALVLFRYMHNNYLYSTELKAQWFSAPVTRGYGLQQPIEFMNGEAIRFDPYCRLPEVITEMVLDHLMTIEADLFLSEELANATKVAKALGVGLSLSEPETLILELALRCHSLSDPYHSILMQCTAGSRSEALDSISYLTGITKDEAHVALSAMGRLRRTGIIAAPRGSSAQGRLKDYLQPPGRRFMQMVSEGCTDMGKLFVDLVQANRPTKLKLEDYAHIQKHTDILIPYLQHAFEAKKRGVNVFVYGAPGTGKTEYALTVAEAIAKTARVLSVADLGGAPIRLNERLTDLSIAQYVYSSGSVIIADEVEGFFKQRFSFSAEVLSFDETRSWIIQQLESNAVPTIWISNQSAIDPALLRRFDHVIEMITPPERQRRKIIERYADNALSGECMDIMAKDANVQPGLIERSITVAREAKAECMDRAVVTLLEATLSAQGHKSKLTIPGKRPSLKYDTRFINANVDLGNIAAQLREFKQARILLSGEPGTGKSKYGEHLSELLDQPLIIKRGSDLRSAYVGETEQNIAKAFREATDSKSILMIDEFNGFSRSRELANRSWEANETTEVLVQLEQFEGVFIGTTNRKDDIDSAMFRRFDLHVELTHLTEQQVTELLYETCDLLEIESPRDQLHRIAKLTKVAPGDINAILRRSSFDPITTPHRLLELLEEDIKYKSRDESKFRGFRN